MALQTQSIREARRDQIFPKLDELEIERVRRFGNARSFAAGESLWTVGQVAAGLMVIVTGKVAVAERDQFDNHKPIVIHGPGNFLGELALLSGRPALVDAIAQESGEALIIPPERLRALMIAEAELGERIMRALILRRMAILEAGVGGPIILGRPENGDVLRLEGFLRRNDTLTNCSIRKPTHLQKHCSNASMSIRDNCRSCCVRVDSCCAIPMRMNWRGVSVWCGRSTRTVSTTSPWSAPDRQAWPPLFMPHRKDSRS